MTSTLSWASAATMGMRLGLDSWIWGMKPEMHREAVASYIRYAQGMLIPSPGWIGKAGLAQQATSSTGVCAL